MKIFLSGIAISILCAVHVFFPNIERVLHKYKNIWVQVTGGMAVGYVFLYMLPRLSDDTSLILSNESGGWEFFQYRLYLIALLGFMTYFGVDILNISKKPRVVYWRQVQDACFCFYNVLVGYAFFNLPRNGILPFFLATFIFSVHFMGLDNKLYKRNTEHYERKLRWLMALSLIVGWLVGLTIGLPATFRASCTAFIAGGTLINALNKKLPDKEEDHFGPFFGGVGLFVVIAAVMRSLPKL
jgi:hypothetical protein